MRQTSIVVVSLAAVLACHVVLSAPNRRVPRQAELSDNLDPSTQEELLYLGDGTQDREKRKLEAHTQVKFGAKNAILGFIFGKINGLLDHKTHLVKQLDQFNIQKNKAYNIVSPPTGKVALGQVFSEVIGPKVQLVTSKLGSFGGFGGSAHGSAGGDASAGDAGSGFGNILSSILRLSGPLLSSFSNAGAGHDNSD